MTEIFTYLSKWGSVIRRILNMACFYGGWLICMQEATGPRPLLGPLIVVGLLVYHLMVSHTVLIDIILIVTLALIGTVIDSLYIATGLLTFEGGYACCPWLAPLWITALWALYASSVNHSLEWLKANYLLVAAPMGAAGAISSYVVGVKLGAAILHYPPMVSYAVIGAVWAVVVPLSLIFSDWIKEKSDTKLEHKE